MLYYHESESVPVLLLQVWAAQVYDEQESAQAWAVLVLLREQVLAQVSGLVRDEQARALAVLVLLQVQERARV